LIAIGTIVLMQPDNNQYDFILDPAQKKPAGPSFLMDPKKKIIASVIFVMTVIILIIIGFSVFSSLSKKNNSALVDVYAYQTEIARVTGLGIDGAVDPALKIQTSTFNSFISTDLKNTTDFLAKSGKKTTKLEAASKLDSKLEANLKAATTRNSFDEEFKSALEKTSTSYKLALKEALDSTGSESEKKMLQTAADNILTFEK
jgi:hypothetical protein